MTLQFPKSWEGQCTTQDSIWLTPPRQQLPYMKRIVELQIQQPNRSNQQVLNDVMDNHSVTGLNSVWLGKDKFLDGRHYFFQGRLCACCSFPHDECCPRSKAFIQHNNIAYSLETKRYRYREQLMWEADDQR